MFIKQIEILKKRNNQINIEIDELIKKKRILMPWYLKTVNLVELPELMIDGLESKKEELIKEKNLNIARIGDLEKQNADKYKLIYDNIIFDLAARTLEIGIMRGKDKINTIEGFSIDVSNLKNKTATTILLLYSIIMEINNNGNFEIKEHFNDYIKYIDKYRFYLKIANKKIPSQLSYPSYISSLNTLLTISESGYEIVRHNWRGQRLFQKINTNKSS